MENKKVIKVEPLNFYSNDMILTKSQLVHNHLKLTYQKNLVSDLNQKHKAWAKEDAVSYFNWDECVVIYLISKNLWFYFWWFIYTKYILF